MSNADINADVLHDSLSVERKLFAAVKYGNLDELNKLISQNVSTANSGTLASDMLRNFKNLSICSTTLASRAAFQGISPHRVIFNRRLRSMPA